MNKKLKLTRDTVVIGSALFSMFFGAGNMIFPPFLGLEGGKYWFMGFLGYFIADIGLAIIAILAQIRTMGFWGLLAPIGKKASSVIFFIIILCLGPIITGPRTAATTYELVPYLHSINPFLFYLIFFSLTALLCINESKVVDIVGKLLTPALFLGLCALIIAGYINPLGEISPYSKIEHLTASGIEAGYQSMDVLASTVMGILLINTAKGKGHKSQKDISIVTVGAGIFAATGLCFVYLGLTYLGATVSKMYSTDISKSRLLMEIVRGIIPGKYGYLLFSAIASLACFSTAIAIVSSVSENIKNLFKNKIGYKTTVVFVCILSTITASLGVENLIKLASPILNIIYPAVLLIISLSFLHRYIGRLTYILGTATAIVYSFINIFFFESFGFIAFLPFYTLGFGWVLPSFLACLVGYCIEKIKRV